MEIVSELRKFLVKKKFLKSENQIDDEDSLLETGIVDSVGMLELVSFIEEEYSIKVEEDDLMPENFESLTAVQDYVKGKIE